MPLPPPAPELAARHMEAALALAAQATGLSDPNPRVGCVIASADGLTVLGQGHTQAAGSAHAEVMALRDAQARGLEVRGATVFVTLEPCAHHGRTPPCCDALIHAGVGRVVAAVGDPNPLVNGQGMARLAASGIATEWAGADAREASVALNIGFFSRMARGQPWVRMKLAGSLDGITALPDGRSQWITGPEARADGHAWRRRAGVVLTGIGTVLADDPSMDVRAVPTARQPLRAVVDSRLRMPAAARMLQSGTPVRVYHLAGQEGLRPAEAAALDAAGAQRVACPADAEGRLDLRAVIADLGRLPVNEIHLEAGARLSGAFWRQGLVDEVLLYQAPVWLGSGRPLLDLAPRTTLPSPDRPELIQIDCRAVGHDLRLRLRAADRAGF